MAKKNTSKLSKQTKALAPESLQQATGGVSVLRPVSAKALRDSINLLRFINAGPDTPTVVDRPSLSNILTLRNTLITRS